VIICNIGIYVKTRLRNAETRGHDVFLTDAYGTEESAPSAVPRRKGYCGAGVRACGVALDITDT
jgi:hypothetical protein